MADYALVTNSVIVNVAVVDPSGVGGEAWLWQMSQNYDFVEQIDQLSPEPGIGWTRVSVGNYTNPDPPPPGN